MLGPFVSAVIDPCCIVVLYVFCFQFWWL